MSIITIRNLSKTYKNGGVAALAGIDLEIDKHTIFGYLGPNGAGKTTTIKILTGLMKATAGTATVAGYEVGLNSLQVRSHIGYLCQNPKYYSWMTGNELLHFTGELFGLSSKVNKQRAAELLTMAGLKKAAKRRIGTYSGGMVQRIGIAQALVSAPDVLFLDEPVSALDPLGRKEVLEFIQQLKESTTVFMSTHILEDVERICDQVGIIHNGKIIIKEDVDTLKEKYAPPRLELGFELDADRVRFSALIKEETWARKLVFENNCFVFRPADFADIRDRVLKLVTDHKLSLNRLVTNSATLEDVFVKLIGGANA